MITDKYYLNEEKDKVFIEKTWDEFKETGLLWWINMILHTFGWALTIARNEETGEILKVYPARCKLRGFSEKISSDGYIKVSKFIKENAEALLEEAEN